MVRRACSAIAFTWRSRTPALRFSSRVPKRRLSWPTVWGCRSSPPTMPITSAESDADAHDVLLCVNTKSYRSETNRMKIDTDQLFIRSPQQMYDAFPSMCPMPSRVRRRLPTASTSTSISPNGTFRSSRRRRARPTSSTCGSCAKRACCGAMASRSGAPVSRATGIRTGCHRDGWGTPATSSSSGISRGSPGIKRDSLYRPWFGLRGHRLVPAGDLGRLPDQVRPAVRAVPRSQPVGGSRYRHRLLPRPAGTRSSTT